MLNFLYTRETTQIKNKEYVCNEFNVLINIINNDYTYLSTLNKNTLSSQSNNIFLSENKLYIQTSRNSSQLLHMNLYNTPVNSLLNFYPLRISSNDTIDTLIIGLNLVHLLKSNIKLVTNTSGYWISIYPYIIFTPSSLRNITIYDNKLRSICSLPYHIKDVYKNSRSTLLIASLSYDKLLQVFEFKNGYVHLRDSVITLLDHSQIFSVSFFHTGFYIVQYKLSNSASTGSYLSISFRFDDIINTFTSIPITYTYIINDYTIVFSLNYFFILCTPLVNKIYSSSFDPLLYPSFPFDLCPPVVTNESSILYISLDSDSSPFLCVTNTITLSTFKRPIPHLVYTYIYYNHIDCIISLGTIDGVVVHFDFFY